MRHFDDIEGEERREYTYNVDSVSQRVVIVQNPVARHEKDDGSHVIMAQTIMGGYVEKEIEAGWDDLDVVFEEGSVYQDLKEAFNREFGDTSDTTPEEERDARDVMAMGSVSTGSMSCLEHDPESVPPEKVCGFYPSCGCNTSMGDGGEGDPPNPPMS